MEIQVLKKEYKEAIKRNVYLKAEIAAVNRVSTFTVDGWRYSDHLKLTTATNLAIIRKFLKLDPSVELTESKEVDSDTYNVKA